MVATRNELCLQRYDAGFKPDVGVQEPGVACVITYDFYVFRGWWLTLRDVLILRGLLDDVMIRGLFFVFL